MLRRRQQPTTNKGEIKARQHNPRRNMFGEFPGGTRPRGGAGQPDEQRAAWIVLQIADHPVGAFPPPGGKIMAADAFGILRKIPQQIFCFQ